MRPLYRFLLATSVVYPVALVAGAVAFGLDWTLANRLPLLAASFGVGAAVLTQAAVRRQFA
ncbi:hypothetical protein [Halobacterium wangiae]|uniref:hypothetical protein n=1 Tax=Halobacterium wangiae TaxID=2902623 RepID=UPI001E38A35F|nr:hypothetical protein [Halobacterium wangiae]